MWQIDSWWRAIKDGPGVRPCPTSFGAMARARVPGHDLDQENRRLKQIEAALSLEYRVLKDIVKQKS